MSNEQSSRRSFLQVAGAGIAGVALGAAHPSSAQSGAAGSGPPALHDVRTFGARGDGKIVDTPAINRAIEAVASAGGGTLFFPAGTYLCYTIRLRSKVSLYLDRGATILAAETGSGGWGLPP